MARWSGCLLGIALAAPAFTASRPSAALSEPILAAGDVTLDAVSARSAAPVLAARAGPAAEGHPSLVEAVELLRRGLVEPGRAALVGLARGSNSAVARAALPWLAHVAARLPDPVGVAEALERYSAADLETLRAAGDGELYPTACYLRGRVAHATGRYAEAVGWLSKLGAEERYAVEAYWFMAASHVRLRRAVPAIHALRALLRAIDGAGRDDAADWRDRANLALARIYHAAAVRFDPETNLPIVDPKKLSLAVRHWDRVDVFGRYGQQALYERATAYEHVGDVAHALGDIHSVLSPHYALPHPEAALMKIGLYYDMCDYAGGATLIARLTAQLTPLVAELDALLRRYDGESLGRFATEYRAGRAVVAPVLEPLFEASLAEPKLRRRLHDLRRLQSEQRLLARAGAEFRSSRLGTWAARALATASAAAAHDAGEQVRTWLASVRSRMYEALRGVQRIMLLLPGWGMAGVTRRRPEHVVTHEEFVLWPFDGEYWRDELGSYRQIAHSRCIAPRPRVGVPRRTVR